MPLAANRIWYADHRRADNPCPPVLLIHGAGGSHLDWSAELRRLPNAIAADLAAHGRSTAPARTNIRDMAADMLSLLDALSVEHAVLLGHSMGGAVALQSALDHPDRTRGLILIGTGAALPVHPSILDGILVDHAKAARQITDWQWSNGFDEAKQRGCERMMRLDARLLQADFAASNAFDMRDQLAKIRVPTLIIAGTADRMTPLKYSEYLRDYIPNAYLITIPGGSHMMMLEQPQAVANAVNPFLEQLCKS